MKSIRIAPLLVCLAACSSTDLTVAPPIDPFADAGDETISADGGLGELHDARRDSESDTGLDGGSDTGLDMGSDSGSDTGATEAAIDSGIDGGSLDTGSDTALDMGTDTKSDAGFDGGADLGVDAFDAGSVDTGFDAGADFGLDLGVDAGVDAGACLLVDDGTTSDRTLRPCWNGAWYTESPSMTPIGGTPWPSTMLPDGSKGRRTYGSLTPTGSADALIQFYENVDWSARSAFVVTLQAGPTETATRVYDVYISDAGRTRGLHGTATVPVGGGPIDLTVPFVGATINMTEVTFIDIIINGASGGTNWDVYISRPRVEG
jgi:hypothetical protein